MPLDIIPDWISNLEEEEVNFMNKFILSSGALKEIASLYDVTYHTVRLRLDRLIQKIQISEETKDESFISLIKQLAIKDKMDFNTAKIIISKYKKNYKRAWVILL
ncbi:DUF2089 family protein [Haloplasma contractile]|uniref:DUF2089 domain-containing protein n=1 Tax=Haloplasma contractile SSD-17B TaxID=1033810 RepID=U2FH29_9MOLU|nr:DUF2089 family protein [Haloplasma contractile]ERJ12160.1 hypothetical protein HLPCO_001687 [Haloplasma contractile SSD-17B]